MNMEPRGKQPPLRNEWFYELNGVTLHSQLITVNDNDQSVPEKWRGKPNGCKRVLQEHGLWP